MPQDRPAMRSIRCNVLLVSPRFAGRSFWNLTATCEALGAKTAAPPLGLITVAAMLPKSWECRLVNRNAEELVDADLQWADMVMTGGMIPQRPDALAVIELAQARGKPVVVGGPDVTSAPEAYAQADFQVLGEAEGVIEAFIEAWSAGSLKGVFEAEKFKIDVTKTPIPRYDLLKRSQYLYYGVQFARGCPFTCEFCDIIELYGRAPRVKTAEQILAELDTLYRTGYRGHLDFVDDNFIGNKKAVKAVLPHLIAWQKAHGYPFEFSTEASINLADDAALLALMREANFLNIFVGIESPDPETLVSTQKKQNTRRVLDDSVRKIYRAGIFVHAGFIVGFDSEKDGVAAGMTDFIEAAAIPVCMVGLLFALPHTQLGRRLEKEGRMLPQSYVEQLAELGAGDQCTAGLNFHTARPRREILLDFKKVLQGVYDLDAYYSRVRTVARTLNRPKLDRSRSTQFLQRTLGTSLHDLSLAFRILWRVARRQPEALGHVCRAVFETAKHNREALPCVFTMAAFYLHLGPFSRYVVSLLDQRIAAISDDGPGIEQLSTSPVRMPGGGLELALTLAHDLRA
jgi:radical SAM superfamily enzyme YgiQ (UPF0313 family)